MKILVTGGAGFIGSHLVDSLIDLEHEVVVVDSLSSGKFENINKEARFYRCNIAEQNLFLEEIFEKERFDFVYHLAAQAKIPYCTKHPWESTQVNLFGTLRLLELSRKHNVKGFVFSSSSSVYGEVEDNIEINELNLACPISIYAVQKYTAEQYVSIYNRSFGLPTASLRYFNVYGTNRQSPDGPYANVFSSFYRDKNEKGRITIYGNGSQVRDFVHVYDVVDANMKFLSLKKEWLQGDVFNVGTGRGSSIVKIARLFDVPVDFQLKREGDPQWSCANIDKIKGVLDWRPRISLEEGVKIYFNSFQENHEI